MSGITRNASAQWFGPIDVGHGELTSESGALEKLRYTFASRTSAQPELTDPEELLAAAHAGCFAMALTSELTQDRKPPVVLSVSADVTLAPTKEGRRITLGEIVVEAQFAQEESDAWFSEVLERADRRCPFSALIRASGTVVVSGTIVR
ncbi:OsmC family peroxiredoxin [Streptomyces sp. ISID311]|uniref:OsmC family peroxiredoxin n=1 Tax=Streptomyces sp. ISID311 TaxID=2601673 RepID=UPI0011BD3F82|nr:OsmC family peroxiredoxin [Streptomyces sp. ISID311]TXC99914.1 OsmC family peroxiredoxin [Streptomyces sp. ISID311]